MKIFDYYIRLFRARSLIRRHVLQENASNMNSFAEVQEALKKYREELKQFRRMSREEQAQYLNTLEAMERSNKYWK